MYNRKNFNGHVTARALIIDNENRMMMNAARGVQPVAFAWWTRGASDNSLVDAALPESWEKRAYFR